MHYIVIALLAVAAITVTCLLQEFRRRRSRAIGEAVTVSSPVYGPQNLGNERRKLVERVPLFG
jgi:hypothetical protein